MHTSRIFPTNFAIAICKSVGLDTPATLVSTGNKEWCFGLQEFQLMIVGGVSFDDALIAYHGVKLSKRQIDALRMVEVGTKNWISGHVVGVLIDKLARNTAN